MDRRCTQTRIGHSDPQCENAHRVSDRFSVRRKQALQFALMVENRHRNLTFGNRYGGDLESGCGAGKMCVTASTLSG